MCKFLGMPHANIVDLDSIDVRELYDRVRLRIAQRTLQKAVPAIYRIFYRAERADSPKQVISHLSAAE